MHFQQKYLYGFLVLSLLLAWGSQASAKAPKPALEIHLQGVELEEFEKTLASHLAHEKISVGCHGRKPCIFLRADIQSQVVRNEDVSWKWVETTAHVQLIENLGGGKENNLGNFNLARREGSADLVLARQITLKRLSKTLTEKVSETLREYPQK